MLWLLKVLLRLQQGAPRATPLQQRRAGAHATDGESWDPRAQILELINLLERLPLDSDAVSWLVRAYGFGCAPRPRFLCCRADTMTEGQVELLRHSLSVPRGSQEGHGP